MKIVFAPQTFKGSISALEVARAMAEGVVRVLPEAQTELVPVADGGDGTLETLVEATDGQVHTAIVTGPLGQKVKACWGALGDGRTAVVEMARVSGLALVPLEKRDPLHATTYGLGEIIAQALQSDFRSFIIGIGGSATNDAGAGMAQALGVRLLDVNGCDLPFGGAALANLDRIDVSGLDSRVRESTFSVACDVSNPLTGPEGASAVYGPQKGATPEMVDYLDTSLSNFARVVDRYLGKQIENVEGSGAAGGLGGGLIAFLGGTLRAGVDIVLDAVDLDSHLTGADLVITGEGQLDYQTVYNKAPIGVAKLAKARGIPVIAISGSLGTGFTEVHKHGIDAALSLTPAPVTLEESSQRAYEFAASTAEQAMRLITVGKSISFKSFPRALSAR